MALALSLHKFSKQFRNLNNLFIDKLNSFINIFCILILLFLTWFSTSSTLGGFGLKQFVNPSGGIEKINYQTVIIISLISFFALLYKSPKWGFFHTLFFASLLTYFILLASNMYFNGEEGYYTFKQSYQLIYICIILILLGLEKFILGFPRIFIVMILTISVLTTTLAPSHYRSPFMGHSIAVIKAFLNSQDRQNQIIIGMQMIKSNKIMEDLDSNLGILLTSTRNSDLNSRWLNSLSGSWTDKSWSTFYNIGPELSKGQLDLLLEVSSDFRNPIIFIADYNLNTSTKIELVSKGWILIEAPG
jgi:hypothetical protein